MAAGLYLPPGMTELQRARALGCEATFLGLGTADPPLATLATANERLQEAERRMSERGEPIPAVPIDPKHRRVAETAQAALVIGGPLLRHTQEAGRRPDPRRPLTQETHRVRCDRVERCLREGCDRAVSRLLRASGERVAQRSRHRPSPTAAVTLGAEGRWSKMLPSALVSREDVLQLGAAGGAGSKLIATSADATSLIHTPQSVHATAQGVGDGYARPEGSMEPYGFGSLERRYAAEVLRVSTMPAECSVSDVHEMVTLFKRFTGEVDRTAVWATAAETLWNAAESVLKAQVMPVERGVSREAAKAASCRHQLEGDFDTYLLGRHGSGSTGDRVRRLVESLVHQDPALGQEHTVPWARAFFCLRAGDAVGAREALYDAPDDGRRLAELVSSHWPPVRVSSGRGGERAEVTPGCSWAENFRTRQGAGVYEAAVRLLLSRAATSELVCSVGRGLQGTAALRFAQDHAWFHLALCTNCGGDDDEKGSEAAVWTLRDCKAAAANAKASDLNSSLDPLHYCKFMLWSQQPEMALREMLLSWTAEYKEFAMESLHMAALFARTGAVDSDAVSNLIAPAVKHFALSLVKKDPAAAFAYLCMLPKSDLSAAFASICTDREVVQRLVGRVGVDGKFDLSGAAVSQWAAGELAAGCRQAAAASLSQGSVLGAVELLLLAFYICRGSSGVAGGGTSGVASDVLALLNPALTSAIDAMCDGGQQGDGAELQQVLSASRLVYSHFAHLKAEVDGGKGRKRSAETFARLYWVAVLCWNTQPQRFDEGNAWTALVHADILPTHADEIQAKVDAVNMSNEPGTISRAVHWAVVRACDLVLLGTRRQQELGTGVRSASDLAQMGMALLAFQAQLREQARGGAQRALQHRCMLMKGLSN